MSQGLVGIVWQVSAYFLGNFLFLGTCLCDKYIYKFIKVATLISQVACYLLWVKVFTPIRSASSFNLSLEHTLDYAVFGESQTTGRVPARWTAWLVMDMSYCKRECVCGWGKGEWDMEPSGAFLRALFDESLPVQPDRRRLLS